MTWRDGTSWVSVHPRVVAVAQPRIEGTWKAYIDTVPGENHELEVRGAVERGQMYPLPESWARAFFPGFAEVPYAE